MNIVTIIGRLTKAPSVSYTQSQMAVARMSVAIDRGKDKDGKDKGADFPSVIAFGKTAELCERYLDKGSRVGISGRLQTGKYEKDGQTIYTTDVIADRVEFLSGKSEEKTEEKTESGFDYAGFSSLSNEDIPF